MDGKRISPIISEETYDFIKKNFHTVNQGTCSILDAIADLSKVPAVQEFDEPLKGIQFIIQGWDVFYRDGVKSLKGVFSEKELGLVHSVWTIRKMSPSPKDTSLLIDEIEDAIVYDGKDKPLKISGKKLLEKLRSLDEIKITFLYIWCHAARRHDNLGGYLSILA
ncbi:hypothetical protein DSCO28_73400 (plasmid) [Desulfosarcina ovata subsp. sediminis]|uniref:Uncharacterized protein n=1 Tax=Desulfosarcina ovata subsp. sediminis TaxID=885957 RepID=A0A5K8A341_9BACT|nr:hypothetical protein [Desulfosarcina ovata]BBO86774.1 hypothetical protein DSCO28_73400 [Desulfosarcina ovata subsp. sediminis]